MGGTPLQTRVFEMIDGQMYVYMKAIKESGLSVSYYWNLNSEGSDKTMLHPRNKKIILVKYECINEANQKKIIERYGCTPYEYIIRQPILHLISRNNKAKEFFISYTKSNGDKLPLKRVHQYCRAVEWLDMLNKVTDSSNKMIKELGVTVPIFYNHVKTLLDIEKQNGASETHDGPNQLPGDFPTSYQRLLSTLKEYNEKSFECIIDKRMSNNNAAKIFDQECIDKITELIKDPRQLDDTLVCMFYCMWAKENDKIIIKPPTVGVWRRKLEPEITMSRYGNAAYDGKYIRQVKGLLPSIPLALVEHDDNNLDFLFSDSEGYNFNKYVSVCVIDSRTKLLLGKSYTIGRAPQQWQLYHAYLDAMYYIRSKTGAWHLPHQTLGDRGFGPSVLPFLQKLGKYAEASKGNKHRGYIEQFFGSSLWKRSQQMVSMGNWSGNNITAKNRGVNVDFLKANTKNRPQIGIEAEQQIENFFHLLRNMPDIKRDDLEAPSKEDLFMQEWNQLHDDDKRPISDEHFLLICGIKHMPKHSPDGLMITNRGIEPQINGIQYSYDLPESWMYDKLRGAKVNVIYDPFDMSRVLITNYDDIRFIAKEAQLVPRALHDHYTNSRTYLNALLAEKKDQVSSKSISDQSESARIKVNSEALMQGGVLVKAIKNNAEHKMLEEFNSDHEKWLDDNNDFSQFFSHQ